jgi:hypothetical protein
MKKITDPIAIGRGKRKTKNACAEACAIAKTTGGMRSAKAQRTEYVLRTFLFTL